MKARNIKSWFRSYWDRFRTRLREDEWLDISEHSAIEIYQNLDEMAKFNQYFGMYRVLLNGLDKIYENAYPMHAQKTWIIVDVGCGSGDGILAIQKWAQKRKIICHIIGIDVQPMILAYAKQKTAHLDNVTFELRDIRHWQPKMGNSFAQANSKNVSLQSPDIICMNNICHHFDNDQIIVLWQHLATFTKQAILVNDLNRHWLAYWGIAFITKWFRSSRLSQHDGPSSVLNAFKRLELKTLAESVKPSIRGYRLTWHFLFRWQLLMFCAPERNDQT